MFKWSLVLILAYTSVSYAAKLDFEPIPPGNTIADVQTLAGQAFANPTAAANEMAMYFGNQRLIGWQAHSRLELSALDLIGYLFSLEKSQFYASAGRWKAPEHLFKDAHLSYYQKIINPESAPYSSGLSHKTTYTFAEIFLKKLMERSDDIDRQVIKVLAQGGQEFWLKQIVKNVFSNPNAEDAFVAELIEVFELTPDYMGSYYDDYNTIAEGVLLRSKSHPGSNVRHVLAALYGRSVLRRESAEISANKLQILNEGSDCSDLLQVDAEFAANGAGLLLPK